MKQWLETRAVLDFVATVRAGGERAALATVVRVRGSAYRHEGAKLAVAADGKGAGNVSGGCLEQDVREVALQVLRSGEPQLRSYCSSSDEIEAWDLGVGCEGQVDLFIEPAEPRPRERALLDGRHAFVVVTLVDAEGSGRGRRMIVMADTVEGGLGSAELDHVATARARALFVDQVSGLHQVAGRLAFFDVLVPPPQLIVCGGGDDARPLVRFAADVGFRVVVADRRPGYLSAERFPAAVLVRASGDELAGAVSLDAACYAVVMTHNFADDTAYLRALLRSPVPYIGMLGPRQRTERILRTLAAEAPLDEARVYGPVGLDIGTDGAEQVGLAVLAEMLAVRSGRHTQSLRERPVPIHAQRPEPPRSTDHRPVLARRRPFERQRGDPPAAR